jgi:threonine dehydrogenase-like Zn-dependent dehydrogenase
VRGVFTDGSFIQFRTDLPEPQAGPGEVCLRVLTVGICDTDLQLARGYMGFRGILGHEFVGRTHSGERVTAEINNACHACSTCQAGFPGHCPHRTVLGILNHDGAMAERVCVPSRNLHHVPAAISNREAVFIEPLAAAYRITKQLPLGPANRVAVIGDGKLGILCTWVIRSTGARTTLVGKHPEKMALAGSDVATVGLSDAAGLRRSFDLVVECTGSPSGLPLALELVEPCGTVVLKTTVAGNYDVALAPIVIDEVRVIGSRCGPFPEAIEALRIRAIDVRPLIEAEYPLERAQEAFAAAGRHGARKVIIHVSSAGALSDG